MFSTYTWRSSFNCRGYSLTRVLGEELKPHRISVNELIPGPVKTYQSSQRSQNPNDSLFDPNNEWIKEPEDVIPLVFFLASQPQSFSSDIQFDSPQDINRGLAQLCQPQSLNCRLRHYLARLHRRTPYLRQVQPCQKLL